MRSLLNTIKRWWMKAFKPAPPVTPLPPVLMPPAKEYKLGPADHRREHGRGKR